MWEVEVGRIGESNGGNGDNWNCITIKKGKNNYLTGSKEKEFGQNCLIMLTIYSMSLVTFVELFY